MRERLIYGRAHGTVLLSEQKNMRIVWKTRQVQQKWGTTTILPLPPLPGNAQESKKNTAELIFYYAQGIVEKGAPFIPSSKLENTRAG